LGVWLQLIGRSAVDTVTTVTIPVVILLWLLAWLEASGRLEPHRFLAGSGWRQTIYGAGLAAIPGCAGGIAVSKMYVEGLVAPAALWAAHIATAGDASFVLLVGRPLQALGIFAFLFVLGSVSGIVMSARRRAAAETTVRPVLGGETEADAEEGDQGPGVPRLYGIWVVVVVAAVLAAILANAAGAVVSAIAGILAVFAVVASIGVQRGWTWPAGPAFGAPAPADPPEGAAAGADPHPAAGEVAAAAAVRHGAEVVFSAIRTAVKDASEITLWVAVADLAFYAVQQIWGPQVKLWMDGAVLPVTLIAVIVGMIPGCGPQIFLARLFTAGSLPFAAILANSVSQHGDSIFPLLGRRRGQALRVTISSTVLALAVGLIAVAATGRL
jgi:hypothetical protein